jgi:hypothetical protein
MTSGIKSSLMFSLGILIGGITGAVIMWVNSHSDNDVGMNQQAMLENIFQYSNTSLTDENNACEGDPRNTVGEVVASLLEFNKQTDVNKLSYGCYGATCTMSISDCKPWQSQECSSRFLKFNMNDRNEIDESSFSCFDMP